MRVEPQISHPGPLSKPSRTTVLAIQGHPARANAFLARRVVASQALGSEDIGPADHFQPCGFATRRPTGPPRRQSKGFLAEQMDIGENYVHIEAHMPTCPRQVEEGLSLLLTDVFLSTLPA